MKNAIVLKTITAVLLFSLFTMANAGQYKFGTFRQTADSKYEFDTETTQIPLRLKDTGFRFGVVFDNPNREAVDWYVIVHLPAPSQTVTGSLNRVSPVIVKSSVRRSTDKQIAYRLSFNEGDPLGAYRLELWVNDVRRLDTTFNVVKPK